MHPTPLCLLIESPNTWASVDERLTRFNKHLELSTRILEGEEKKVLDDDVDEHEKPSALLKECQKQGRQWFHFILLCGINGPTCVPFVKLREETADWDELVSAVLEDKIKAFVQKKVADLQTSEILRVTYPKVVSCEEIESKQSTYLHELYEFRSLPLAGNDFLRSRRNPVLT